MNFSKNNILKQKNKKKGYHFKNDSLY